MPPGSRSPRFTFTFHSVLANAFIAIFIPLPSAVDDHQTLNAGYLVDAGAAVLCPQASLTPQHLAATLSSLLDRAILLDMAKKSRAKAQPTATATVVAAILSV